MRILFDQGTPKPLAAYLPGHTITLASQMGWSTLKNGELLSAAELAGFDLMITTDRNLAYQQNLTERKIAIVVLGAGNWPRIEASVAAVVQAVERVAQGTFEEVAIP
jgi:predicted nuclease of predicted toxin-antitoxin system